MCVCVCVWGGGGGWVCVCVCAYVRVCACVHACVCVFLLYVPDEFCRLTVQMEALGRLCDNSVDLWFAIFLEPLLPAPDQWLLLEQYCFALFACQFSF